MEIAIKANGGKINNMAKENIYILIQKYMMENLKMD